MLYLTPRDADAKFRVVETDVTVVSATEPLVAHNPDRVVLIISAATATPFRIAWDRTKLNARSHEVGNGANRLILTQQQHGSAVQREIWALSGVGSTGYVTEWIVENWPVGVDKDDAILRATPLPASQDTSLNDVWPFSRTGPKARRTNLIYPTGY